MAAIDDPGPRVCAAAIRSLGLLGVQAAHDQIAVCLGDRDLGVVRASIVALGRLGQAQDVASLSPFLDSEHPKEAYAWAPEVFERPSPLHRLRRSLSNLWSSNIRTA